MRAVLRGVDTGETDVVEAAYLIGANGAHSQVRSCAGIGMDGPDDLGDYHRVDFRAPLHDLLAGKRHGLYVITDAQVRVLAPAASATDRGCRGNTRRTWDADFEDQVLVPWVRFTSTSRPTATPHSIGRVTPRGMRSKRLRSTLPHRC